MTTIKWDTPEKAFDYFEARWDAGVIDDDYVRELVRLLSFLFGEEERHAK